MTRVNAKKGFDCIAFKRQAQAEIYREIRGLSAGQEIEYFRQWAAKGPLGEWWKSLERRSRSTTDKAAPSAKIQKRQAGD
jgi:hypothetical protein